MMRWLAGAIVAAAALLLPSSASAVETTVSVVYFYPRGEQPVAFDFDARVEDVRAWYGDLIGSSFSADALQLVEGEGDAAYYQDNDIWRTVLIELGYWCGTGVHVVFVHESIALTGGGSCSDPDDGGTAMMDDWWVESKWPFGGVLAHELGHAFGLSHSDDCGSVMHVDCWTLYPDVGLTDVEITALQATPWFGGPGPPSCVPKFNPHGKRVGRCRQ